SRRPDFFTAQRFLNSGRPSLARFLPDHFHRRGRTGRALDDGAVSDNVALLRRRDFFKVAREAPLRGNQVAAVPAGVSNRPIPAPPQIVRVDAGGHAEADEISADGVEADEQVARKALTLLLLSSGGGYFHRGLQGCRDGFTGTGASTAKLRRCH